uniref:BHLH domain-containing protein n=1 Tax=Kalanchoe fedtschenkoi TaxID=63787 RepID=A0A7N0UH60_KALFE
MLSRRDTVARRTTRRWPASSKNGRAAAAASSSRSHTEAEKRRRDRINGHLLTLRKLVPKSDKMDKAALLARVIQHVKGLQGEAAEVGKALTVPTDVDEVRISTYAAAAESTSGSQTDIFMEASLCCEDRPELFAEIDQALQSLNLSTARVEMGSLGGRVRIILLLSGNGIRNDSCSSQNRMINLKGSLNVALNRIVNSTPSVSSYRVTSKRQRFFLPSDT